MTPAVLLDDYFLVNYDLRCVLFGDYSQLTMTPAVCCLTDQIPASHLLVASVMSAPAALAVSKLMCPETSPRSNISSEDVYKVDLSG